MKPKSTGSGTHKKAAVILFEGLPLHAYLNPAALGRADSVELLTSDGELITFDLSKVKAIHFVREFTNGHLSDRKTFLSRPKLQGLWVRCLFRDRDSLEGIVPNNLAEIAEQGLRLTPPDLHGNTLWIFVPRAAVTEVIVLGVVGVPRRRGAPPAAESQSKLFDE